MIERKRIGDLEFRQATYLLPKEKLPENPAWHIDYWYPNGYYGRESEFIKDGDWYLYPDNHHFRVHKDCFKNPQSCMAIASFNYNSHEGCYELEFVGDRPMSLPRELKETFWELLKYGFNQLNNKEYDTTSN